MMPSSRASSLFRADAFSIAVGAEPPPNRLIIKQSWENGHRRRWCRLKTSEKNQGRRHGTGERHELQRRERARDRKEREHVTATAGEGARET
eukprot:2623979-Rhodomonas_salina.4